jgi:predicted HAD superfamily phosphohydrolase YqeG
MIEKFMKLAGIDKAQVQMVGDQVRDFAEKVGAHIVFTRKGISAIIENQRAIHSAIRRIEDRLALPVSELPHEAVAGDRSNVIDMGGTSAPMAAE